MDAKPQVVIYACQQAVPEPEVLRTLWGTRKLQLVAVPEPCSSKVEAFQLLRTLGTPAELVWVIGCVEPLCRYEEGSRRLGSRLRYTQRYLEEIGLEPERLGRSLVTPGERADLEAAVAEIKDRLKTLAPNPLRKKAAAK